jgi:hypothetical protein
MADAQAIVAVGPAAEADNITPAPERDALKLIMLESFEAEWNNGNVLGDNSGLKDYKLLRARILKDYGVDKTVDQIKHQIEVCLF